MSAVNVRDVHWFSGTGELEFVVSGWHDLVPCGAERNVCVVVVSKAVYNCLDQRAGVTINRVAQQELRLHEYELSAG